MKHLLAAFSLFVALGTVQAQLPDGSIAPDWTLTSIDSVEYNLYSLLDSGYQVILDFSATWCGPCWNYHTSGVLEELYELYGPEGSNEIRVFFIEGDDSTTLADLQGTGTATAGNWVAGTQYPIIDNGGETFDLYECTYYPTIYTICPNKVLTQSGQASVQSHANMLFSASCMPASFPNDPLLMDYSGDEITCGENPASLAVRMMNNGLDTLTACTIQVSKLLPFNQTEVIGTSDWEGSLGTYEFTSVDLMDVVIEANTTFVFDIISEDDVEGNNNAQGSVSASEESTNNLEIQVRTDSAPEQLGWTLTDDNGFEVASVLPNTEMTESLTLYSWDVTLPALGCYTLTLLDAGGDGLYNGASTMAGVGYLRVNSMDGESIVDEDVFFQEIIEFEALPFALHASSVSKVPEVFAQPQALVFPNPVASFATLQFTTTKANQASVEVLNAVGQRVLHVAMGQLGAGVHVQELDLSSLESGHYLVRLGLGEEVLHLNLVKP